MSDPMATKFEKMALLGPLTVVVAVVLSEILVACIEMLLLGRVTWDYLVTGLVTSFLVSAVVIPILMRLVAQRRSNFELSAQQRELRNLLDHAPIGIWRLGSNGRLRFVNKFFCDVTGISEEKFIDATCYDQLYGAVTAANCKQSDAQVLTAPGMHISHEEIVLADGNVHHFEILKAAVYAESGATDGLIGIASDITERIRSESALRESEEKFRNITESSLVSIYVVQDGVFKYVNPTLLERTGYSEADLLEKFRPLDLIAPEHRGMVASNMRERLEGVPGHPYEIRVLRKNGTYIDVVVCGVLIQYQGRPANAGSIVDITEQKRLGDKLHALVDEQNVILDSTLVGLAKVKDRTIIWNNAAFEKILAYGAGELVGASPRQLYGQQNDYDVVGADAYPLIESGTLYRTEMEFLRKDGKSIWVDMSGVMLDDGNQVSLWSFVDVTDRKNAEALIARQANYDQLTQLPNRRLFNDRLMQVINKSHRDNQHVGLLLIDLDRFKEVNDTLGHDIGDLLLVEAADRITACARDYDTVARLGGDEFTVTLPDLVDTSDIGRLAQAIIDSLTLPFQIKDSESFISASVGIAIYPDDATNATELVKNADQAMYQAKKAGRGCFSYFTWTMQQAAEHRMRLAIDLRHALEAGQLEVHYQPIVSLADGAIRKAEALLRWNHPDLGQIGPATFIPIAEETGTIHEIGHWVFMQAALQTKKLTLSLGHDFQISINKSPIQFNVDAREHSRWIEQLNELGLPCSSIVAEITEGLLMDDNANVSEGLLRFRDAGIQVAIDDFGTVYSALSYLKKFHIDYLKIDQSFTRNLAPDSEDYVLCEAIVVMAHKLGIQVIAEGVETAQQRDLLKQIGCDFGQGYLFAKPVPAVEFECLLKKG